MANTKSIKKSTQSLTESDVFKALNKKALGYETTETIEEYSLDENGEEKLIKKKITKKNIPPDISAVKILFDIKSLESDIDLKNFTDEELDEKIQQILKQLKEQEDDNNS